MERNRNENKSRVWATKDGKRDTAVGTAVEYLCAS